MIKKVSYTDDFDILAKLLNDSFETVAKEFGLTKKNCPTNNAFITADDLKSQLDEKREFNYLCENDIPIGFIAVERSGQEEGTFYIEKVAVHPDYRHNRSGIRLMDFATNLIRESGGKNISIGIIDANIQLKKWYKRQGFTELCTKTFDHLPFDVCYMEKFL